MKPAAFALFRKAFHAALLDRVLSVDSTGIPSNADKSSAPSKRIAASILENLGHAQVSKKIAGQTAGSDFESICADYIRDSFGSLGHIRPGDFDVRKGGFIAGFQQYAHLDDLERIAKSNLEIATALGSDYLIKPDIIVSRMPLSDDALNASDVVVDHTVSNLSGLRRTNDPRPILHASVSCKWTLRSDRAQNARSEGLNLVRNRKGALPHVVVVTGEPLPSRIASLALGTGDIDNVYHFALHELRQAVSAPGDEGYRDTLEMMIEGGRLKDISDLPLDLAI